MRPKCRWCSSNVDGIGCQKTTSACSTAVSNIESCPSELPKLASFACLSWFIRQIVLLTASPNRDEVSGGQNVALNGPLSLNTFASLKVSNVTCAFTLPSKYSSKKFFMQRSDLFFFRRFRGFNESNVHRYCSKQRLLHLTTLTCHRRRFCADPSLRISLHQPCSILLLQYDYFDAF